MGSSYFHCKQWETTNLHGSLPNKFTHTHETSIHIISVDSCEPVLLSALFRALILNGFVPCSCQVKLPNLTNCDTDTYKAMLVGDVVRQLQFVEGHDFLHPLLPRAWWVRMNVHPLRHFGIGFSRHHPARVMELVSAIVHGNGVHKQDVLGALV